MSNGLITRNARIKAFRVASRVWGLYDLDSAAIAYTDELGARLLDLLELPRSREALLAMCLEAVRGLCPSEAADDAVRSRLEGLSAFRAVVSAAPAAAGAVLLVDPPCPLLMAGMPGPARGLVALAAALLAARIDVRILDMRSASRSVGESRAAQARYLATHLAEWSPAVVGVTAVSATVESALFVARLVRELLPAARVVLGGPHASYEWNSLLRDHTEVDAVVIGEGERSFPRFVSSLTRGGAGAAPVAIEGVASRDAAGDPTWNGWSPRLEELDEVPMVDERALVLNAADFPWSHARIVSARGCPFACSFCSASRFADRTVRYRDVGAIVAEIAGRWARDRVTSFSFDDDHFVIDRLRTLRLCADLARAPFAGQLPWGCNARLDALDDEIVAALASAGCRWVLLGIESGTANVRDRVGKALGSLEQFRARIQRLVDAGIQPQLNFIIGLPGETEDTIEAIWPLVRGFPTAACTFNFLNVFPGTPLASHMGEHGLSFVSDLPDRRYRLSEPCVRSSTMSEDDQIAALLRLQWHRKVESDAYRSRET